jgi:LPXTG-motif cell wall-anchored protein
MTIINRRNAVLGWGVWKVGKKVGKRKMRKAAPTGPGTTVKAGAAAGGLAALTGALFFWRKKKKPADSPGSDDS